MIGRWAGALCLGLALAAGAKPSESRPLQDSSPLDDGVARPGENDLPGSSAAEQIFWNIGDRVFFAKASATLDAPSQQRLTILVPWFNHFCPAGQITIAGHTDETGNRDANLALSRRRALAVARFFVARGLDTHKIDIVGKGWFEGAVMGHTEYVHGQNRRAVIVPHDCPWQKKPKK